MSKVLLMLIGVALLELTVIIEVGTLIGALPTVGLLVLSTMLGATLVRNEGIKTLLNAQQKIQHGEMPSDEVMGGLLLALAGVLLVLPGFLTDMIGVLLLQPWLRQRLATLLLGSSRVNRYNSKPSSTAFEPLGTQTRTRSTDPDHAAPRAGTTIEGEFERKE
jgi:UPF0716 protein FxsA